MSIPRKIAVHFQEECICGQVHEVIHHMKDANIDVGWKPLELTRLTEGSFVPHVSPERTLEFKGACGKVELNGMRWEKGKGVVCGGCGVNLIYGLIGDVPEC